MPLRTAVLMSCQYQEQLVVPANGMSNSLLALAIGVATFIISLLVLLATFFERLLRAENEKQTEERLRLLESVVVNANDAVLITEAEPIDESGPRIIYVNAAFTRMTGYSLEEVRGKTPRLLQGPKTDQTKLARIRTALQTWRPIEVELLNYRKDKSEFWVELSIVPVADCSGWYTHWVSVQREITERKQLEGQLLHNAFYDILTGLPNRALFMERLSQALEQVKRYKNYQFAVLFLDLDRFKAINDSLGHLSGDQFLIAIARRIETCLRATDTAARLGGDEFTVLLEDINDVTDALQVSERIQQAIKLPFKLNEQEVFTTASIGIALSATGYNQPEDLLRDADTAMYRAKVMGKARSELFDPEMHNRAVAVLQLETDLRHAIERQEFRLQYQPIVSLSTGRVTGFEALCRWQHPKEGFIFPHEFIPAAVANGLIIHLDQWVLHTACKDLQQWQLQFAFASPLTLSVNLSSKQFTQPNLVNQIQQVLQETDLAASSLRLEITEGAIAESADSATTTLWQLRALGVQLAIDDFGVGYSSLGRLHDLPINGLKIDRSFVTQIGFDAKKAEIVSTIVTLAHKLGVDVTAQGVETQEQVAQLRSLNCEYGQGFFLFRPLNPEAVLALLIANPQC